MQVRISDSESFRLPRFRRFAHVLKTGNITEVTFMDKESKIDWVKVSKTEYLNLETGETKEIENHSTLRNDNISSMRSSFRKIRTIINANVSDCSKTHWITLTYADNMQDVVQLRTDFDRFFKRFRYYCQTINREVPNYITVIEPQERGAWHIHAIFMWQKKIPFIENKKLADLWSHGFVRIQKLDDIDNLGAYLSAYLCNAPVDSKDSSKGFQKGKRLHFYPANCNIFRHSKGLIIPKSDKVVYDPAEGLDFGKITFIRKYDIIDDEGEVINTITKFFFNKLR